MKRLGTRETLAPCHIVKSKHPYVLQCLPLFQRIADTGDLLEEGDADCIKIWLMGHNDPYKKLTSIINDLNNRSERYCVVVQVINTDSLTDNTLLYKKLESFIRSLTKRELEVFDLSINGFPNKLIAEKLFITVETVKSHRKNIVSKAG